MSVVPNDTILLRWKKMFLEINNIYLDISMFE